MTNLIGKALWSDVRLLESHEYAQGGENGNMNEQAKALINRTEYLRGLLQELQQAQQNQQDWQLQVTEQINGLLQRLSPTTIGCDGALAWLDIYRPNQSTAADAVLSFRLAGGRYLDELIRYELASQRFYDATGQDISESIQAILGIEVWDQTDNAVSSEYDAVIELWLNSPDVYYRIADFQVQGHNDYQLYPAKNWTANPTLSQNPTGAFNACLYLEQPDNNTCQATEIPTQSQQQSMPAQDYCLSFEVTENNQTSTLIARYHSQKSLTLGVLLCDLMAEVGLGHWTDLSETYMEFTGLLSFADKNGATVLQGLDANYLNGISSARPILIKLIASSDPVGVDLYDFIFNESYPSSAIHSCGYSVVASQMK